VDKSNSSELGQWATEVNAFKRALIKKALHLTGGNQAEAGRLLGLHPVYFSKVCKELNVK
jgi:transcriptional regulator with GAF, ATPase, and Fis domain